jgi:3',5'-cyclic AMP phosphodiesterase CpdA
MARRTPQVIRMAPLLVWWWWAALLPAGPARADDAKGFFFIQLTDPQLGMYTANKDFRQETANFEFAIATINRLKPAFVVVTGDLVNKPGDANQVDEYLRIAAKLDRTIPLYNLPGNHDVGNDPNPGTLAAYTARFGPDHYAFRHGNMVALVLNSNIIHSSKNAPNEVQEQETWFKGELQKASKDGARHVIVFQHHSLFLKEANEPDTYDNLPREVRGRYLDLLRQHGVTHVFAGHYHRNQVARDGGLEVVTSGPIGKPLRKEKSGLRVVIVRDSGIEHRYYEMSEIPNMIDLSPPKTQPATGKTATQESPDT